jgi:hypothetical protein
VREPTSYTATTGPTARAADDDDESGVLGGIRTGRGNRDNMPHCHSEHSICFMTQPGTEPGSLQWEASA